MDHLYDELSKSLAEESLPRRESLQRIGVVLAGAVLSPLRLSTAWARATDPCTAFCKRCPGRQRDQCLAACKACGNDTSRLCGTCGSYACCREPGPWEYGACIDGRCQYVCAEGAVYCDGICTFLGWNPDNCGACGNVCGGAAPFCFEGACRTCEELGGTHCGGECDNLLNDPYNCGACGQVCSGFESCAGGVCQRTCIPDCGPGSTHGEGWCGDDGCGGRCACTGEGEYCPAFSNWCAVSQPSDF